MMAVRFQLGAKSRLRKSFSKKKFREAASFCQKEKDRG
jgi:hypothetical protein